MVILPRKNWDQIEPWILGNFTLFLVNTPIFFFSVKEHTSDCRGVACFAMYRSIGHLNLWRIIDRQGVCSEHQSIIYRSFKWGYIDRSQSTPRHWATDVALHFTAISCSMLRTCNGEMWCDPMMMFDKTTTWGSSFEVARRWIVFLWAKFCLCNSGPAHKPYSIAYLCEVKWLADT